MMALTKEEVKTLCEANDKLEWWAMVLFAEMSELVKCEHSGYTADTLFPLLRNKVNEFERLVVQEALKQAKVSPSLEERVTKLEELVNAKR